MDKNPGHYKSIKSVSYACTHFSSDHVDTDNGKKASPLEQERGPVAKTHQSGIMCKWHYTTIQEATHTEATHREATRQYNDTQKCNRYYYTFIFGQTEMVILI